MAETCEHCNERRIVFQNQLQHKIRGCPVHEVEQIQAWLRLEYPQGSVRTCPNCCELMVNGLGLIRDLKTGKMFCWKCGGRPL